MFQSLPFLRLGPVVFQRVRRFVASLSLFPHGLPLLRAACRFSAEPAVLLQRLPFVAESVVSQVKRIRRHHRAVCVQPRLPLLDPGDAVFPRGCRFSYERAGLRLDAKRARPTAGL